jgi:hypothetical protein
MFKNAENAPKLLKNQQKYESAGVFKKNLG